MTDTEKKLAFLLATSPYLDTLDGKYEVAAEDLVANGVVPVVRCYQCKYYAKSMVLCHHEDGLVAPDKMDYCSYGERKDGDTDG